MQTRRTTRAFFGRSLLVAGLCIIFQSSAQADLIINLRGVVGSPVVNYDITGSIIVPGTLGSSNSATEVLVPLPNGPSFSWGSPPALPGNPIKNGLGSYDLSSPGSYFDDGNLIYTFSRIGFRSGQRIGFDQPTSTHPQVIEGSVLSWTGAGTFTLLSNFEDNLNTGSYAVGIAGGNYVVNITVIPEPSSLTLLALIGGMPIAIRRRRKLR